MRKTSYISILLLSIIMKSMFDINKQIVAPMNNLYLYILRIIQLDWQWILNNRRTISFMLELNDLFVYLDNTKLDWCRLFAVYTYKFCGCVSESCLYSRILTKRFYSMMDELAT